VRDWPYSKGIGTVILTVVFELKSSLAWTRALGMTAAIGGAVKPRAQKHKYRVSRINLESLILGGNAWLDRVWRSRTEA
jgi:hypothetical protein